MPKHDKGSVKDLANRMKARGLQKLKFYCQMCSKQCRDENGFKCHLMTDAHLRQMKLLSENTAGVLDRFSRDFERGYLEVLRRRHGVRKRTSANGVYQEVIADKHHVHMNATKWATLSDFVQYLGKTGQCVVDETERGWYISLVERDPTKLARQELLEHRAKAEKREEERLVKRLEAQRRHEASKPSGSTKTTEPTNLDRTALPLTVPLSLPTLDSTKTKADKKSVLPMKSVFGDDGDDDDENDLDHDEDQVAENPKIEIPLGSRKRNRWDASENAKDASSTKKLKKDGHGKEMAKEEVWPDVRKEHWIRRDIWVRIVSKSCEYYKQKGIVDRISKRDKLMADVEVVVNMEDKKKNRKSHFVKVHQNDLETVIPKSSDDDPMVVIVNGRGRGELATVISMDKSKCRATLELKATGDRLEKVYFEDFSKAA